jgi:hypothetical protein
MEPSIRNSSQCRYLKRSWSLMGRSVKDCVWHSASEETCIHHFSSCISYVFVMICIQTLSLKIRSPAVYLYAWRGRSLLCCVWNLSRPYALGAFKAWNRCYVGNKGAIRHKGLAALPSQQKTRRQSPSDFALCSLM